jgi:hypothetical protein
MLNYSDRILDLLLTPWIFHVHLRRKKNLIIEIQTKQFQTIFFLN